MSRNTHWCDSKTNRSFYCLLTTDVCSWKQVICRTLFFQIIRCMILQLWKVTLWSTSTFLVTHVLKCDVVTHSSSKNNLKINNQKISVSLPRSAMLKLQFWRFACHSEQRRHFDVTEAADLHLGWTPAWISKGRCFFSSSLLMILSSQPCQTGWMSSWDMKLSWWNPPWGLSISEVNFKHKVTFLQSSAWRVICGPMLREEHLIAGLRPMDGAPTQGWEDWNIYWRAGPS